jgi:hemerythrin-like domain-containing protein
MLERYVNELMNDGDPDLTMMVDIAEYIRTYSDLFHHPKEDKVYEVFKKRTKKAADIVDSLLDDHQHIPGVTLDFQQLLTGAINGSSVVSRDDLSKKITHFIDIQRTHLNTEEKKLFPLINKMLKESDWAELEALVQNKSDPLFGTNVEETYECLYQTIKDQQ